MSNVISFRVSKTVIKDFSIDLDEWYSYQEMNKKQQHEQIQRMLEDYQDFFIEDSVDLCSQEEDWDLLEWELS